MKKEIAINYIETHNLIGIKAGLNRETFLDIWMIVVNDRIFARSWGLAEKSWYNSFLQDSKGQIKCGENIFNIKAIVPIDKNNLTSAINNAYLTKYNTDHNIKYAKGIIKAKHIEKTLEFIIKE
ncbi:hypothetical protein SAMN05444397_103331 [Flavobacterium aquidurense]|uniref:DUF2255 family protein n=1 Tax=Flavobacterium frigidimaris TaxID=262320 RepID=A0ABX4BUH0_FLAFR|nr:DUF2255 family protein [Flavobacterium frigidimaris]OXA80767.1 hypothetical protein B0A65_05545 [Flavobacterium frigidimaris]SDZ07622.1 hypothetical protein SAMN05444397_103331 [Flavobacterium aquidurense]